MMMMAYKNDSNLVILNRYGKMNGDNKAELYETYDRIRDLTVSGPTIGANGLGKIGSFAMNLARSVSGSPFLPTFGSEAVLIPGTSYYGPQSGGNGANVPAAEAAFGLSPFGQYPGFDTTGGLAANIPLEVFQANSLSSQTPSFNAGDVGGYATFLGNIDQIAGVQAPASKPNFFAQVGRGVMGVAGGLGVMALAILQSLASGGYRPPIGGGASGLGSTGMTTGFSNPFALSGVGGSYGTSLMGSAGSGLMGSNFASSGFGNTGGYGGFASQMMGQGFGGMGSSLAAQGGIGATFEDLSDMVGFEPRFDTGRIAGGASPVTGQLVNGLSLASGAMAGSGFGRNFVMPLAGIASGIGGLLTTLGPFLGPWGSVALSTGSILSGAAGAVNQSFQHVQSRFLVNADSILTQKVRNLEITGKMLDAQEDIMKKLLKDEADGDKKLLENL
ncbi:MAG: hypothetical protein ACKO37_01520 [Vampirovibrionales bacterium]